MAKNLAVRVAVISDIHANLHALEAVFAEIETDPPDAIWCLGDLVGYGPRPNRCCTAVAARAALSLCGNHDLGVLGELDLEDFAPDAVVSALWTREVLSEDARTYLGGLEPRGSTEGVELVHGSPRDPVWDYVLSEEVALESLAMVDAPLLLVGHSHVPLALRLAGEELQGGLAPGGFEADLSSGRWLLNPGSVGQPRDGDSRAAYLLLDLDEKRASFRRVVYPVEQTQAEIQERGLPESLAERLTFGA